MDNMENTTTSHERPIERSYWVDPGHLLAGVYPGAKNPEEARSKVRRLLRAGVTFLVDLTEEGELVPYEPILREEAAAMGMSVGYHRVPIRDLTAPTPEVMTHILNTIDAALEDGHVVYVHCWGGKGRTGTVVGCYLVRHGMTGEEALETIKRLRADMPLERDRNRPSPETPEQRALVLNWSEEG